MEEEMEMNAKKQQEKAKTFSEMINERYVTWQDMFMTCSWRTVFFKWSVEPPPKTILSFFVFFLFFFENGIGCDLIRDMRNGSFGFESI